jgi:hypothetical protein
LPQFPVLEFFIFPINFIQEICGGKVVY